MVRLMAATPLLVFGLLALGGCVTHTDRPLYAGSPAYYDPYWPGYHGPPAYAHPYYAPRPYSSFSLSFGRGRHHGHHHARHRHRHWW